MEIKSVPLSQIVPYGNNPRKNAAAVEPVKQSIKAFGFKVPMILDRNNVIVTGHTRFIAARELGMQCVPVIYADDLTEEQIRAFRLADNKTNEFAQWDDDLLGIELESLTEIDMSLFGFDLADDVKENKNPYTGGVDIPQYEITGECPVETDLYDNRKTEALISEINCCDMPEEVRKFLVYAAYRHTVFNYRRIAEYYANAPEDIQRLMERSALVIIDYDNAIANGYATLTADISDMLSGVLNVEK